MIAKYKRTSFRYGIPGLLMQAIGFCFPMLTPSPPEDPVIQPLLLSIGLVLLIAGLSYYAKSKGRYPLWGFFGLLSILGLLVLLVLKDKTTEHPTSSTGVAKKWIIVIATILIFAFAIIQIIRAVNSVNTSVETYHELEERLDDCNGPR